MRNIFNIFGRTETHQLLDAIFCETRKTNSRLERIEMKQDEAITKLNETNTRLKKVGTETQTLLDLVKKLQDAAASGDVSPELQAAIEAVATQAQVVDDEVPDGGNGGTPPTP